MKHSQPLSGPQNRPGRDIVSSGPPICDYEASSYRTDFWEGQGRQYEDAVERIALKALLPAHGQRLLDVGAGFGRLADLYAGYDQVILLDYSRSQLEYARARLGDERFIYVAADIYRLPLATHAVDAVVMVRVLHHLADVPLALAHIARALCPQGSLVLEFANKRHLKNVARFLVGRGTNPFETSPYEFAELHFDFHPAWVMQKLESAGLPVEASRAVSLFRSRLLKRIFPIAWLSAIDGALQRPFAPWAIGPSQFVRSRAIKSGEPGVVSREALFRCPRCGYEPLDAAHGGLTCPDCKALWPLEHGIYLFK
ncbi:MAG: class I SAM-dependent methyltransferase [Anaerolineae bacterium]|nr:class I SAM-dependent methyltransferase [Anaerolineae bacterium]